MRSEDNSKSGSTSHRGPLYVTDLVERLNYLERVVAQIIVKQESINPAEQSYAKAVTRSFVLYVQERDGFEQKQGRVPGAWIDLNVIVEDPTLIADAGS